MYCPYVFFLHCSERRKLRYYTTKFLRQIKYKQLNINKQSQISESPKATRLIFLDKLRYNSELHSYELYSETPHLIYDHLFRFCINKCKHIIPYRHFIIGNIKLSSNA